MMIFLSLITGGLNFSAECHFPTGVGLDSLLGGRGGGISDVYSFVKKFVSTPSHLLQRCLVPKVQNSSHYLYSEVFTLAKRDLQQVHNFIPDTAEEGGSVRVTKLLDETVQVKCSHH